MTSMTLDKLPPEILGQCLPYLSDHDLSSLCLTNKGINRVASVELYRVVTWVQTSAELIESRCFTSFLYPNHKKLQYIRHLNIESEDIMIDDPYFPESSAPRIQNPIIGFMICFFDRLAPNQLLSLSLDYAIRDLPTRFFHTQQNIHHLKMPAPNSPEQRDGILSLSSLTTLEITYIQPDRACYVEQVLYNKRDTLQSLHLHFRETRMELRGEFARETKLQSLRSLFSALIGDSNVPGSGPAPRLINICIDSLLVDKTFDMDWGKIFDLPKLRKFEIVHPIIRIPHRISNCEPLTVSIENHISKMAHLTHLRIDNVKQIDLLDQTLMCISSLRGLHLELLEPGVLPSKAALWPHKNSLEYLWFRCRPSPNPSEKLNEPGNNYIFPPDFAEFKKLDQLALPFDPKMISSLPRLDTLRLLRILARETTRPIDPDKGIALEIEEGLLSGIKNEFFPPSRNTGQLLVMFGYGGSSLGARGWSEKLFSTNILAAGVPGYRKASVEEARLWSPRLDMLEAECEWRRRFPN
ncbi:hypothetical protein TWF696_004179 [Orbilia brochopaga]|uniref:F-box domain-containing protein n=1 Tax=Orbilia brochopaga TaxID=3140254 RepID=A0AAV9V5L3_9PEZI